jgi:ubiquinone/menaquinone biosynthesis C-methylase UbiE
MSFRSRAYGENPEDKIGHLRKHWDDLAPRYDKKMRFFEKLLFPDDRQWACSLAEGDTLEIAIGTGRNLSFYPSSVRLTGIDLSPAMLEIARQRSRELGRVVDLQIGDAQSLAFPEGRFHTVVCTLSLCCVPDDRKAVSEMKRVLRPGGKLVLLDHVRSDLRVIYAMQRLIEPIWIRSHSDSLLRRPFEHVEAEGLDIERHQRLKWGIVERVVARKPHRG